MPHNKYTPHRTITAACLFLLTLPALLLHGCAGKPWTQPVNTGEAQRLTRIFAEMQQRDATCPGCLDARATLFWKSPGEERAISGFLQLMLPASMKYVVVNPLGQTLYALISTNGEVQSINTTARRHLTGTLPALAREYKVPDSLLSNQWGYWLTGRLQEGAAVITGIREDEHNRGIWISLHHHDRGTLPASHLLIQPTTLQLLGRILEDAKGNTIATISYEQRGSQGNCAPAGRVTITDLPYGSELRVELSEIITDRAFSATDFTLKVPTGYDTRNLPE